MDKFEKIAMDPFYCGVVEVDRQVKVSNPNGLHERILTTDEHKSLLEVFAKRVKYQIGPKRLGNPQFPMNNIFEDDKCLHEKNGGRAVGFEHTNGKYLKNVYERYRCRSCGYLWLRSAIHAKVTDLFQRYELTDEIQADIIAALETVWKQNERDAAQEIERLQRKISSLKTNIKQKVDELTKPENEFFREELKEIIEDRKLELHKLEKDLSQLINSDESDKLEFMKFALSFVKETGELFLAEYVSKENRLRCKQLVFTAGILMNHEGKVYTPEVSMFYRLAAKKKDTEVSMNSHLVRVRGLYLRFAGPELRG